jgi:GTP-binding protein LepA
MGSVLSLAEFFRFGTFDTRTIGTRIVMKATLPLADMMSDLDDRLKSLSEGYASMSYEVIGWQANELEKVDVLVAGHIVPGLTRIMPKADVDRESRLTVERLRDLLPRQQFSQAIQASVRGRIVARETVPAMKKELGNFGKNGGDRTRKMKLWKKQKEGKARLMERAERSEVTIPASVFRELMKK